MLLAWLKVRFEVREDFRSLYGVVKYTRAEAMNAEQGAQCLAGKVAGAVGAE